MTYKKILIVFLFISCQGSASKNYEVLVNKIEETGVTDFKPVTYKVEGNIETYTYSFTDSTQYLWTYNLTTKKFDLPAPENSEQFKTAVNNPSEYVQKLRNSIQSLGVTKIDQSPWLGSIVRFWMSDLDRVTYIDPAFKFDHTFKIDWMKEMTKGLKIKENWYYVRADQP